MTDAMKSIIANLIAAIVVLSIMMGMAWWMLMEGSREEGPWGNTPSCTPQIADAGGICHGEPGE